MLRLKFQSSGHLMPRAYSVVKTLTLGKTGQKKQVAEEDMVRQLTDSVDMNLHKLRGSRRQACRLHSPRGRKEIRKGLSNRTTTEAQVPCSKAQAKGASYLLDEVYPEKARVYRKLVNSCS